MATRKEVIKVDGKPVARTLKDLQKDASRLRNILRNLDPNSEKAKQYAKEFEGVNKQIRATKEGLGIARKSADKFGFSLQNLTKGTFWLALIQGAFEIAKAFGDTAKELVSIQKAVNSFTGAQGAELDQLTSKVRSLSKVYEQDYNDVLNSANTLSKEFGITANEALDLIENGFLAGANNSGEFLDQLKEYPAQFKAAGLTAEQSIGIITQSVREGVFSDKGADVIKEVSLRLREFTPAVEKALAPLGEVKVGQIREAIAGGDTLSAIKTVSESLSDTGLTAQQTQTIIADVFGGPGEDAGLRYLQSLKDINSETSALVDATNPYIAQQQELLESEEALALAQSQLTGQFAEFGTDLNIIANGALTLFFQGLNNIVSSLNKFRAGFSGAVAFVKNLFGGDTGKTSAEAFTEAYNAEIVRQLKVKEQAENQAEQRALERQKAAAQRRLQVVRQTGQQTQQAEAIVEETINAQIAAKRLERFEMEQEFRLRDKEQIEEYTNFKLTQFEKEVEAREAAEQRKLDAIRRANEMQIELAQTALSATGDFINLGIQLMGKDEEARRKNAEKIKTFTIAKIFVDLANEIAGYFATVDSTLSLGVTGAIKAAAATARAVAAVAQVRNRKFATGGLLNGPLHSSGGIKGTGSFSNVEVEGGEFIVNRAATAQYLPLLESINGSVQKYETGGRLPTAIPQGDVLETLSEAPSDNLNDLKMEFRALREDFANFETAKRVVVNYTDIEDAAETMAEVRRR